MLREPEPDGGPQTGRPPERGQETAPGRPARWRPLRLALHVMLRVFAILALLLAATVAWFGWRISHGPIEADFLTPTLEAALSSSERGLRIELGGAGIGYDAEAHAV